MTSTGESSKKRNSFSLLTRKDLGFSSKPEPEEPELANSRFIPESKRGWKYDIPTASSTAGGPSIRRPKTATATQNSSRKSNDASATVLSAPVSPKTKSIHLPVRPDLTSSDSSSSAEELGWDEDDQHRPQPSQHVTFAAGRHPDDLVYPESYPWKPSLKNPKAKYINPAHRNPTAKQAFYDTHFGSSSNYRGLLPASGSLLGLSGGSSKATIDTGRRSSDAKGGELADGEQDAEANGAGIVSTMKKPFTTASKFLTKARRRSVSASAAKAEESPDPTTVTTQPREEEEDGPQRPHPVPLYTASEGATDLRPQRSGFSYGLSLEDAVQVEAVVSRQSSQQDLHATSPLDALPSPPAQQVSAPKWREAMHSVWGFLPSIIPSTSPQSPDEAHPALPSGNLLEAEAIPSVKKDPGNPDYFKNLSGNVVMLGGYRGSVLRDAETNMMMWIPIKVGVGLRRPTLELGLSTAAEENSEELVYSSDMCTSIGKLVDMGKRLEERIAGRRHAKVYAWGYDWRLSLARSSARLVQFLEELYDASSDSSDVPKRGAKVIAHSMGGLVALHVLTTCRNPRVFEGLVFASTPFCGTPNILGPFRFGDAALFNDTICSPRATFSFRSSFYLLPTDQRCFEVPVGEPDQEEEDLTEEQRSERFRDVDFLDADVWNELGLSPCLEVGRRQEIAALRRKSVTNGANGDQAATEKTDANDKEDLEKEASKAVGHTNDPADGDLDVASPQGEDKAHPNGLTMGLMEGLTDGAKQPASNQELDPSPEEQLHLQPENRQGASRNTAHSSSSPASPTENPAFDKLDYSTQSWLYLERTLSEVRQFWSDISNGFNPSHFSSGAYPPLMLLVSGRTPCVRGALVGVDSTTEDGWKDDVRAGDYSRMTYAAGDGVITRRSATTLPGRWSELLAKRSETETLPEEYWGKGPPYKKKTGKARMKLDRYRMRFEGEGMVESAHRHVTLLSDVDGVGKCLEAVRRANLVRGRLPLEPVDAAHA